MPWKPSQPGEFPTLGFGVIDFIESNLAQPGRAEYRPYLLTREQIEFIVHFYALDPRTGQRIYRRAVLSRAKGFGKSPFLSSIAIAEALADVVPDGWDSRGQPVGKPWSEVDTVLVQIAASSEDQTANAWGPLLEMLRVGPVLDNYDIQPMETFVALQRGKIQPVSAAATSREGARPIFALLDQALALDTPIPTPSGWTTMGEIRTGDLVIGSDGTATRVVEAKPVSLDHDCYRVTFQDGTSVVASEGHLWQSRIVGSAAKAKIRTTGEMYRDAESGSHMQRAGRRALIETELLRDPTQGNTALAKRCGTNRKTVFAARAVLVTAGRIPAVDLPGGSLSKPSGDGSVLHVQSAEKPRARKFAVPAAPARVMPEQALPAHPYLVGLWLGDGTRGKCEIAVSEEDLEDTQRILADIGVESWPRRYLSGGTGLGHAVNLTFSRQSGYQASTRPEAAKAIAALPCYRKKHVPEAYLRGSIEQRTQLLRGLMDADGHCTAEGGCTFVNTNRALVDGLVELLRSLGQVTSGVKWVEDDRYLDGGKYRVDFTPRGDLVPFALARKVARIRPRTRRPADWMSIASIELVDRVPVRCIGVESDDHLFAAGEGGHLTHNTESWTSSNGGVRLAAALRRNLGKTDGSSIEAPNAFIPGEKSVAERSADTHRQIKLGKTVEKNGLLYDHREAPQTTDIYDRASLHDGLAVAYGDSANIAGGCRIHNPPCKRRGWVNLDRVISEIYDPDNDIADSRRYYLGQVTHAADSWLTQPEWIGAQDTTKLVKPKEMITLGFDGSRGRAGKNARGKVADSTALIGCRVSDGHLFEIKVWEQPQGYDGEGWEPPTVEVDATVRAAFRTYNVVGFFADPAKWEGYLDQWEGSFGRALTIKATRDHPVRWPMNGNAKVVEATSALYNAIVGQEITHAGTPVLTAHALNARRRPTRGGWSLAKDHPDSPRKIDAIVASILAFQARSDAVAAGLTQPRRKFDRPTKIW